MGRVRGVEMAGVGVSAEWVEGDGSAFRSETFCGRGERSSNGALGESRVRGVSSPVSFLKCAYAVAVELRYCICTARKEGSCAEEAVSAGSEVVF